MCRHLVWLGGPRSLASLLLEPPWSLRRQGYQPRRQDHGLINADGFGIAWYDAEVQLAPARYRRSIPIWTDASFGSIAPVVHASAFLAAVRSTTIGQPVQETDTAPFVDDRWAFSHNGAIRLDALGIDPGLLERPCDATALAQLIFAGLREGANPAALLARVVPDLGGKDPHARLNLLLTDGATAYGTTWGASLSYLYDRGLAAGGVLVASEPLDDGPGWVDVPDRTLLVADRGGVHLQHLEH